MRLGVGLIGIEPGWALPAGIVDNLLDLCLLVVAKFELGNDFLAGQRLHTFSLQLQLFQALQLFGIEDLGNLLVGLLRRLLGFLAHR